MRERLLLLLATCAAWSLAGVALAMPAAASGRPNIVLVILDACRADKFSCYGFVRPTTPAVDELAADPDATVFRRHYVQGGWTKPSTASLFTGTYPFQHGMLAGDDIALDQSGAGPIMTDVLNESFVTLAEGLRQAGYRTAGFFFNEKIDARYGFSQGFEVWERSTSRLDDAGRVRSALGLIGRLSKPVFAYVHLSACHQPYDVKARDREYLAEYSFAYDEKARANSGIDFRNGSLKQKIPAGLVTLEEADLRFLHLLVEAKLRRADRTAVRDLVDGLKGLGIFDSTLLIVTADHGDELVEHGGFSHGQRLWEVITHVPLVVKFPRGGRPATLGSEVRGVTQSVDLLPSLFRFAGITVPAGVAGSDVFAAAPRGWAFSEAIGSWALVRERDKLLALGDRHVLFDLRRDPGETRDIAPRAQPTVKALRKQVERLRGSLVPFVLKPSTTEQRLDKETVEQLRSLGYVH